MCYLTLADDFNENGANKKEGHATFDECFASAPSCIAPWLERNLACALFHGHGGIIFTKILLDVGKEFVPAPLKTVAKVANVAAKAV